MPAIFSDPVHGSQAVFRAVLDALARPGRIVEIAPLPALDAIAAALLDAEVAVWCPGDDALRRRLREQCGCRLVDDPAAAAYAVVAEGIALPPLAAFDAGTAVEPERSATLVVGVPSLRGGPAVRLRGPGIEHEIAVAPRVADGFWEQWRENAARFPLGVDVLFADAAGVLGLPRTAQVAG